MSLSPVALQKYISVLKKTISMHVLEAIASRGAAYSNG